MRFGLVLRSSLLASFSVLLAGCGGFTPTATTVAVQSAPALHGQAHGGQQPIAFADIYVFQVGTDGYGEGASPLAQTTTDQYGRFSINPGSYNCPSASTPVYILVSGGSPGLPGQAKNHSIGLAAGLGACSDAQNQYVDINEVTTAVTAFALSHYFTTALVGNVFSDEFGSTSANASSLALANSATIQMLVDLPTGTVKPDTAQTTIEAAKIYSIANTLAACVNSYGAGVSGSPCDDLFADTTPPGGTAPSDTLQAAVQMALYPYQNATDLYNLGGTKPPFAGLGTAPGDWTVGVSYQSANFGLGINGTATTSTSTNIDIDASGRIWFPSNAVGKAGVGYFDPASQSFNGPYLTSLFHPQYLAISAEGTLYATDLAQNFLAYMQVSAPTTTTYVYDTAGESGPVNAGNLGDPDDTVFFVTGGTSSAMNGAEAYTLRPDKSLLADLGAYIQSVQAQSVQRTDAGMAVVAASSSDANSCLIEQAAPLGPLLGDNQPACIAGGIVAFGGGDAVSTIINTADQTVTRSEVCILHEIACFPFDPQVFFGPKGIAEDGDGNFWTANFRNGSVGTYFYDTALGAYHSNTGLPYLHNLQNGATMTKPYGIAIDGSGNVWVSNAGCLSTTGFPCVPGAYVLSELIGAGAPTVTPLALQNYSFPTATGTRPGLTPPNPYATDLRPHRAMATSVSSNAPKPGVHVEPHLVQKQ